MERSKQAQLEHFFKKSTQRNNNSDISANLTNCANVTPIQTPNELVDSLSQNNVFLADEISDSELFPNSADIGNYVNKLKDDSQKYEVVKKSWKPPPNFKFPFSLHQKQNKEVRRYMNQHHLTKHEWLTYSNIFKGLFCKYCVCFQHSSDRKLVNQPLTNFAKLTGKDGDLNLHERSQYHKTAVTKAEQFCKIFENPTMSVVNLLSIDRSKSVEENRKRIKPIIELLILLGRQNIALRGHRDDGVLDFNPMQNDGNVRQILKYRASGDAILKEHLTNTKSNATYISKTTQNELIDIIGAEIRDEIIERIKKAKYYSVIFDETTDISTVSQLSLVLAYVHNGKRFEDFIDFLDVHQTADESFNLQGNEPKITGKILGQLVLKQLKKYGLNPNYLIGIGTDGCSVMISEQIGAVNEIQKEAKNAFRCPCFNHALNLAISKSSTVRSIRNSIGVIKEIIAFFNMSAKRMFVFKNICDEKLKKLCETRWSDKIEAIQDFANNFNKIVETLEEISEWNGETGVKAKILIKSVLDVDFLVSLQCQISVLHLFFPVTKLLQKKTLDLVSAKQYIDVLISTIEDRRTNCDLEFDSIYKNINQICDTYQIEFKVPRLAGRQRHRENVEHISPSDYFKKIVFIPLLDNIIMDLNDRFSDRLLNMFDITFLIPKNLLELENFEIKRKIENVSQSLKNIITDSSNFQYQLYSEICQLKESTKHSSNMFSSLEDILFNLNEDIYPRMIELVSMYVSLPISIASAERSFSTLKRLKTYLRNSISQDRLVGLALLNIHREVEVNIDNVINKFGQGRRRLDFIIR